MKEWRSLPSFGVVGKHTNKQPHHHQLFNHPHGVAFDPHNQLIAVTDHYNHGVQLLNQELQFVTVVGCKGTTQWTVEQSSWNS